MLFNGKVTANDGTMFSKSKGNGVDPLEIINQGYGADALRTYLMFAAPLELWAKWDPQGVPGTHRFLSRVWTLVQEYLAADDIMDISEDVQKQLHRATHRMIKKMTHDLQENRYNTAIASAMTAVNDMYKIKAQYLVNHPVWQESLEALVSCIAPFAPHIADELWQLLGNETSVQKDSWPTYNEEYLQTSELTIVVQVNGKVRAEISVPSDSEKEEVLALAKANERITAFVGDQAIKKAIYVPGRLVNFVI
jgi:leucyl-tRNA synthetase